MKVLIDRDIAPEAFRNSLPGCEVIGIRKGEKNTSLGGATLLALAEQNHCTVVVTGNLAAPDEAKKSLSSGVRPRISFLAISKPDASIPENAKKAIPELMRQIEDIKNELRSEVPQHSDLAR